MLNTKNLDANKEVVVRKRKRIELFAEFQYFFSRNNISCEDYLPKQVFTGRRGELIVKLDQTELSRERSLFIEYVTSEYNIGTPNLTNRQLWRMEYNPEFETEYQEESKVYPKMYNIPIEEFTLVDYKSVSPEQITTSKDDEDAPFKEMTIRDYLAIHKEIPVSNKPWLNALIEKHLK